LVLDIVLAIVESSNDASVYRLGPFYAPTWFLPRAQQYAPAARYESGGRAITLQRLVRKHPPPLFGTVLRLKRDHFTKTGPGQTQGNAEAKRRFLPSFRRAISSAPLVLSFDLNNTALLDKLWPIIAAPEVLAMRSTAPRRVVRATHNLLYVFSAAISLLKIKESGSFPKTGSGRTQGCIEIASSPNALYETIAPLPNALPLLSYRSPGDAHRAELPPLLRQLLLQARNVSDPLAALGEASRQRQRSRSARLKF
jgi:hypothetical protein